MDLARDLVTCASRRDGALLVSSLADDEYRTDCVLTSRGLQWCPPDGSYGHKKPFPADANLTEYLSYVSKGGSCRDYDGIKAGGWTFCGGEGCANAPAPVFNRTGRTDVEGCCWWGRGVIQTTGTCNFGKLNYYMGKRGHTEGAPSLPPTAIATRRWPGTSNLSTPSRRCHASRRIWPVSSHHPSGYSVHPATQLAARAPCDCRA